MSRKLRGSYYVDGRRSMTLTTYDIDKLRDVGFRLVHDDSSQVDRGGSWGGVPQSARVARRLYGVPGRRYYYLGFRLTADWREG